MTFYVLDDIAQSQSQDWTQEQIVEATGLLLTHLRIGNYWLINQLFIKINDTASAICRVTLLRTCYSERSKIEQYAMLLKDSRRVLNQHTGGEKILKGLF